MNEPIKEGFMVFVSDGEEGIGSVRAVMPNNRPELTVYVENSGDFSVPLTAVEAVHYDKVILNCDKLDKQLRAAIGRAHDDEEL